MYTLPTICSHDKTIIGIFVIAYYCSQSFHPFIHSSRIRRVLTPSSRTFVPFIMRHVSVSPWYPIPVTTSWDTGVMYPSQSTWRHAKLQPQCNISAIHSTPCFNRRRRRRCSTRRWLRRAWGTSLLSPSSLPCCPGDAPRRRRSRPGPTLGSTPGCYGRSHSCTCGADCGPTHNYSPAK